MPSPKVTKQEGNDTVRTQQRRSIRLAAQGLDSNQEDQVNGAEGSAQAATPQQDFGMRLAATLPPRFVARRALAAPIVVLFHHYSESLPSTNDVWVFLSLVDANSGQAPVTDLLQGQRADSIHQLSGSEASVESDFGYASFANLVISASGRYRLRLTAVHMNSTDEARSSSPEGRVLPAITSDAFDVVEPTEQDDQSEVFPASFRALELAA